MRKKAIPEVSVIIPTYNRRKMIKRAIKSVLIQTYCNFELIIVDDGSTDNTLKTISGFDDERIVYLKYTENRGVSAARNSGIRVSRGKYIAFLDNDDEWLPQKLEKQVEIMERSTLDVGVVYTGYYHVENGNVTVSPSISTATKLEGDLHEELLKANFIFPSFVLIRSKVLENIGGFDEFLSGSGEDLDLWLRVSKKYYFNFIKEPLAKRHVHRNNFSFISFAVGASTYNREKYLLKKYHKELGIVELNKLMINDYDEIDELVIELKREYISVVIFGASTRGRWSLHWLKNKGIECKFFVDNDKTKWGKIVDEIEVKPPCEININDIIFIASKWWMEIAKQLGNMGINKFVMI